jgi:hypothetical protein
VRFIINSSYQYILQLYNTLLQPFSKPNQPTNYFFSRCLEPTADARVDVSADRAALAELLALATTALYVLLNSATTWIGLLTFAIEISGLLNYSTTREETRHRKLGIDFKFGWGACDEISRWNLMRRRMVDDTPVNESQYIDQPTNAPSLLREIRYVRISQT